MGLSEHTCLKLAQSSACVQCFNSQSSVKPPGCGRPRVCPLMSVGTCCETRGTDWELGFDLPTRRPAGIRWWRHVSGPERRGHAPLGPDASHSDRQPQPRVAARHLPKRGRGTAPRAVVTHSFSWWCTAPVQMMAHVTEFDRSYLFTVIRGK